MNDFTVYNTPLNLAFTKIKKNLLIHFLALLRDLPIQLRMTAQPIKYVSTFEGGRVINCGKFDGTQFVDRYKKVLTWGRGCQK